MRDWHLNVAVWPLPWSWRLSYWRRGWEANIMVGPFQVETMRD